MGFFLAIEGGDGSGKGTQTKILTEYLKSIGKSVHTVAFPRHGEFSSYYADQYLNGAYGGVNEVHADLASLPYAFDRFAASKEIRLPRADDDVFKIVLPARKVFMQTVKQITHDGIRIVPVGISE